MQYDGNLGGLAGADAKCQTLADGAQLGGTFRAWLSDANTPISQRFEASSAPYVRLDGMVVADNWTALTDGTLLQSAISVDENGTALASNVDVWTGQPVNPEVVEYCQDWGEYVPSDRGLIGEAFPKNEKWHRSRLLTCSLFARLYCFEVSEE